MSDAILAVTGLCKHFGSFVAVDNLDIDLRPGEILALLGPSGCGKTTTLRMLAGLEQPTRGRIVFEETTFASVEENVFLPPNKRNVGMVFQSYALWPHMSAFGNVSYPLRIRGVAPSEIRERVARILGLFGLANHALHAVHHLSGGQQQRVALARALIYEPRLMLFDEPFSNLDAQLRTQMRVELKALQKTFRMTGVFVTHDQIEALSIADRVAIMRNGRIEQIGRPEEVYDRPATRFVRDFLGKSVTLRGRALEAPREGWVTVALGGAGGEIRLSLRAGDHAFLAGDPVEIAVRPEHITATVPGGATRNPGTSAIEGRIENLLFTGDSYESRISVGSEGILLELPRDQPWREEQTVILEFSDHNVTLWPLDGERQGEKE
ncbi:MAG: ABC transporter ATP-binding protein [Betaproteobacteria bacterium]|nr:ABC transporter ATP-binding protein [Betaproteobacteria bacterium]